MAQSCGFVVGCAKIQCLCLINGKVISTSERVGGKETYLTVYSVTYQKQINNNYVGIARGSLSSLLRLAQLLLKVNAIEIEGFLGLWRD